MISSFDKAIAGAIGPLLAWALLALLGSVFGEPPPDVAETLRVVVSLGVTSAAVYIVPNKPKRKRRS